MSTMMISVHEAEQIIQAHTKNYGTEYLPFEQALGRILAEDITADRDLPPCNRVTMDGIAIAFAAFEKGIRSFNIKATQAAGDKPVEINDPGECIEIMTGAALPESTDTIIRYEDVSIVNGTATINIDTIRKSQNIHRKGKDKLRGDIVINAGQLVDPTVISMAASVGVSRLPVTRLPEVVIISTGDELVDIEDTPEPYQIRSSNSHTIKSTLLQHGISADILHIPDKFSVTKQKLENCFGLYDVILLSGGISMGKFDFVPQVLEELGVNKLFHKVKQRPGKPFWFGTHKQRPIVFAFPGNPVSTFMCLHRYFIPWLRASLTPVNCTGAINKPVFASLHEEVSFVPPLQYFMQVSVSPDENGLLLATPTEGNGSGDFANLIDSNAFMELPLEQSNFKKGEVYRIWPFKQIV